MPDLKSCFLSRTACTQWLIMREYQGTIPLPPQGNCKDPFQLQRSLKDKTEALSWLCHNPFSLSALICILIFPSQVSIISILPISFLHINHYFSLPLGHSMNDYQVELMKRRSTDTRSSHIHKLQNDFSRRKMARSFFNVQIKLGPNTCWANLLFDLKT